MTLIRQGFDAVIDLGPQTEAEVRLLVRAASRHAPRVVLISSIEVYSGICGGPLQAVPYYEELTPLREGPPIAGATPKASRDEVDALAVERAATAARQDAQPTLVILRFPYVYGEHDELVFEWPWIAAARDRRQVIFVGQGGSCLMQRIYAQDAAQAIALAAEVPGVAGRTFNVGEDRAWTMRQLAIEIGLTMDNPFDVHSIADLMLPDHLTHLAYRSNHWWADTSAFRQATGYQERLPLRERLARTIAWHLKTPPSDTCWPSFDYEEEDEMIAILRRQRESKAAPASEATAVDPAIRAAIEGYYRVIQERDKQGLAQVFADHSSTAYIEPPGQQLDGHANIVAALAVAFDNAKRIELVSKDLKIAQRGDVAWFTDLLFLGFEFADDVDFFVSRCSGVLIREDGLWRMVQVHKSKAVRDRSYSDRIVADTWVIGHGEHQVRMGYEGSGTSP